MTLSHHRESNAVPAHCSFPAAIFDDDDAHGPSSDFANGAFVEATALEIFDFAMDSFGADIDDGSLEGLL